MKIGHHCDLEPGVLRMPRPDWDYLSTTVGLDGSHQNAQSPKRKRIAIAIQNACLIRLKREDPRMASLFSGTFTSDAAATKLRTSLEVHRLFGHSIEHQQR